MELTEQKLREIIKKGIASINEAKKAPKHIKGDIYDATIKYNGKTYKGLEFEEGDMVDDHGHEQEWNYVATADDGIEFSVSVSRAYHGEVEDWDWSYLEANESVVTERSIVLSDKFTEQLTNTPETGMGFHKVDLHLKNGEVFKNKTISNCSILTLENTPIETSEEIEDITITEGTDEINEAGDPKKYKQFWDKGPETQIRRKFGKEYNTAIANRANLLSAIVDDMDKVEDYAEMDFLKLPEDISTQLVDMDPKELHAILDESVTEGISKSAIKKSIKAIDSQIDSETGGDGEALNNETLQELEKERERLQSMIESVNVNESVIGIKTEKDFKPKDLSDALDKAKIKYKMNRLSMTLSVLDLDKKYFKDASDIVADLGLTVMMAKESKLTEAKKDIDTIFIQGFYKDGTEFHEDQETTDLAYVKKNYKKITKDLKSSEIVVRLDNGEEIVESKLTEASNLLKQDALSPAEYQKAKKLKGFDPANYLWDKKQELHLIRKMSETELTEHANQKGRS